MFYTSEQAEQAAILSVAQEMCAAIRTAPKAKGTDCIKACIVTENEKEQLACVMEELSDEYNAGFMLRDAGSVRASNAVVLAGFTNDCRGLNKICGLCGFENCARCTESGGICIYGPLDLGIALGSAAALAASHGIDNRIMFSVGRAAIKLGYFGQECGCIMGIPLSVSGKSPFFDRKKHNSG